MSSNNYLYVTYIEKFGDFLKVWGQMDRNMPLVIEKSLSQMTIQFESGSFMPSLENIHMGLLCCAKFKDGAYYRARITNISMLSQSVVEVHFLDYGNRDIVPITNIRTIANFAPGLITIPPQGREFVLANVTHKGTDWDHEVLSLISSEIRYFELAWVIITQVGTHTLIKLYKDGNDALTPLFNQGLVLSISLAAQQMILQSGVSSMAPVYPIPTPPVAVHPRPITTPVATAVQPTITQPTITPALVTYKAVSLEPGSENNVYVSYVSDGPCQFSVQLKKLEDSLARLMKELNRMNLQPLEDDPIPGTVCVARCLEDEHICRAVVTSMVDGQYKVFYVDFGNTEVVPLDNLYQIPFKYVIPKVMAMRYALFGLERSSVTVEMKCAFKEFVSDKLLRMRALPPPSRSALPLCMLWDDKNVNVLDVLKRAALLAYPETIQLIRGFSQEVRVSYVHSCSHFYVQIKQKEEELRRVMAELQSSCPHANALTASQIKVGMPCCALFDADGQWYRAQILCKENDNVQVHYVDYGNKEVVPVKNLKVPNGEQLTTLRPQALECCLNGYQNMEDDTERDSILEELILEKEFIMKVVEMQGNRALVDLIDNSRYNVGSLLLERLATARSQVSPLLIQDGHHIEQRKRRSPTSSNEFHQKMDRKPSRDQNDERGWNHQEPRDNNNIQDSWRQPRTPRNDMRGSGDSFDRGKGRRDGFKRNNSSNENENFKKTNWNNNKKEDWNKNNDDFRKTGWNGNNDSPWKRGGKSPNQSRDGSERGSVSDGSEKNWRRSPRTNNDDKRPRNKFDNKKKGTSFGNSSNFNKRDNASTELKRVTDPAPNNAEFTYPQLLKKCREVVVSWFHDPSSFFCQLLETQEEFKKMMIDIQAYYVNIKPDRASVGAPVIAVYPDDGVMYRGRVLEAKGTEYRVQYVDFGNVCLASKVYPIEKKFMVLPAQAIYCGLSGIVHSGDAWPAPDIFSTYFAKDSITCSFMENQHNKYVVELTCDGQNISETLVEAGLAAHAVSETCDPSILLGQQIKVTIVEIEGLDTFYVQIYNGQALLCTLHNLELATERHENVLKEYLDNNVIMYVDNVLEEKLEITLYDASGNKLNVIEPDEGAYDTIEPLCPVPVINSTIIGWISYFTSLEDGKFRIFLQPTEFSNTLAQFLQEMFDHYDNSETESLEIEVGKIYAVHSSDNNWYRGEVESVEDENITVLYVDYGNTEVVAVSELRKLAPEFIMQHMLALGLSTSNIDESYIEQEVTATVWYQDEGWVAEIKKMGQTSEKVNVEVEQTNVVQEVSDYSKTEEISQPPIQEMSKMGVPIVLSHVDSPSEFYIQLSEDIENINTLQATLQEQVDTFPVLENPAVGVLCAAPYSLDQQWYRAQVLDADVDITTVRFVDYGNTDVLENTKTSVKTLPSDLLSLEQHARRCSLFAKAVDDEWSPSAIERFEALTMTENLLTEIIHQDEKTTYVQLYANDQNIAETLLQEGLAVKLELETESSCTGYVSHLNSPSEFWIQLESAVADLEWIAEQLSTAENFPELEDYTPGSLCAALYPDDEMWYRARILSNTVAGLEVLFIDYGNSCTCTGLRQLPEDLIMLPALAQKCSLQKPAGMLQWSASATEEFRDISADGATIFNIVKFSTGETSVVELLLDGVDISTKLISPKQDVHISFYESVSNIWLQNADGKIKQMATKLNEAPGWSKYEYKEGNPVVAALTADGQWRRARILNKRDSTYEVLFIDYGNTSSTNDIRMLPSDVESEDALAVQCKLEPLPGFRWNDETSTQLAKLYNDGKTLFQAEFVSSNVVRLFINENDIRADLDSTSISSAQNTPKKNAIVKSDAKIENLSSDENELYISSDANLDESLNVSLESPKINTNTESDQTVPSEVSSSNELITSNKKNEDSMSSVESTDSKPTSKIETSSDATIETSSELQVSNDEKSDSLESSENVDDNKVSVISDIREASSKDDVESVQQKTLPANNDNTEATTEEISKMEDESVDSQKNNSNDNVGAESKTTEKDKNVEATSDNEKESKDESQTKDTSTESGTVQSADRSAD